METPVPAPAEAGGAEGQTSAFIFAERGEEGVETRAHGVVGINAREGEVPGCDAGEVVGAREGGVEADGFEVFEEGEKGGVECHACD